MENIQSPIQNNSITVCGKICSSFTLSHRVYAENFYSFFIENKRLSDAVDILPVTISERLLLNECFMPDDYVEITGQIRSYNNNDGVRTHLVLSVFVKNIRHLECGDDATNDVMLDGYICKAPVYRTTPFGREIADILLAVNRAYGKSDYIPAICWGRNAKFVSAMNVGANITIFGRMQSRNYQKKLESGESITKTAYEVSASKLEQKA